MSLIRKTQLVLATVTHEFYRNSEGVVVHATETPTYQVEDVYMTEYTQDGQHVDMSVVAELEALLKGTE